jgi:hypothetical protein
MDRFRRKIQTLFYEYTKEINSILFSTNLVQQTTCGTIKVLFEVGKKTLKTEVVVMHSENHNIYCRQPLQKQL